MWGCPARCCGRCFPGRCGGLPRGRRRGNGSRPVMRVHAGRVAVARASDSARACVGLPCPLLWSVFPRAVRRPSSRAAAGHGTAGRARTRRERAAATGSAPRCPDSPSPGRPGGLGRPGHPGRRFAARARRRAVPTTQGASPQPQAPAERCRVSASRWASGPTARRRLSPAAPAPDPPPPAAPARTPPRTPRSDGPVRRGSGGPTRWPGRCRSRPRWRPRPPCGRSRGPRP